MMWYIWEFVGLSHGDGGDAQAPRYGWDQRLSMEGFAS